MILNGCMKAYSEPDKIRISRHPQ